MEILRIEQTATPAVAQYLTTRDGVDHALVLTTFDALLDETPYITPWQSSWLAPAFGRMTKFASGPGGDTRAAWLRSVWDDARTPEPVRASIAQTLARHKLTTEAELLGAYDGMSETSRPALAAALGTAGLDPASKPAKALVTDDDLIRWQFKWGSTFA